MGLLAQRRDDLFGGILCHKTNERRDESPQANESVRPQRFYRRPVPVLNKV
jgi:hypothetical protein